MTLKQINKVAMSQGWAIVHSRCHEGTGREWELQKLDDTESFGSKKTFKSDLSAIRFVKKQAAAGDKVARAAIKFLIGQKADDAWKMYEVL